MASDGLDSGSRNLPRIGGRQRRPQRSCDMCRQRKVRCDGPDMPDRCCSNCLAFGSVCTYLDPPRTRGRKDITVEELKKEIASLKAKLQSLSVCSLCAQPLQFQRQGNDPSMNHTPESGTTSREPLDEEDFEDSDLARRFIQVNLESPEPDCLDAGSSFARTLANSAIEMKEKYLGQPVIIHLRRPLFWDVLPWEKAAYDARPDYTYPPSELITSLLYLYFANIHPTIPILHRHSFERSVAEGLHLTDMKFGGTLLSVLALASRYSDDPHVFVDGDPSLLLSAGWKFATQVRILQLVEPTIYEVQMYCLLALFMLGTSVPRIAWLYIGLGLRFLQQRGSHRRNREGYKLDAEDELWKRAFWSLVALERICCLLLGRPMSLHAEEYDVELPFEVDDEYWDSGFTQPPEKPSQLSFFACHIRLCEILGDVMRRLYGSKKSKIRMGWDGPDWEQCAVSELDSAMNDFVDTVPPHLRWDPENPPQGTFFDQSAILHITYNQILLAIHRPYIQRRTALGAPSLSICAGAARAILRTTYIWICKLQRVPLPHIINPVFVSGLTLVLYMMATKRAGLPVETNQDFVHVTTFSSSLNPGCNRRAAYGNCSEN
ncbi:fungal-specific transcription factor domain-containing protein, partial [Mycena leptocephala]